MAYFAKEVSPSLAKPPLTFALRSLIKQAIVYHQAITWIRDNILLIVPLNMDFSEIFINIQMKNHIILENMYNVLTELKFTMEISLHFLLV